MKILPFAWEQSMGFRKYEGDEPVGYISLNIIDTRCDACEEHNCDLCSFDEQADYVKYRITSTYPLEGFEMEKFYTEIDKKSHVYYSKTFDDAEEAIKRFVSETQKFIN